MDFKVEPLSRIDLDETIRNYVCSTCWGALSFKYHDKKWYAICPNCGYETIGYTSKAYAERRRSDSEHEAIEAAHNLRNILGMEKL